ncbi:MAG: fibronectin type III domain-containing protein [Bacteroidetes bacterium]|nr:MAG: fibronectin type III domain-containing protein [Bacteroidota bacterium]
MNFQKIFFFFLLFYFSSLLRRGSEGEASAQIYPVQLTAQLIPPYSGYLLDYADPTSEKLRIILQFNDFTVPQYNLRLRLEIKGNGFTIQSKQLFNPPPVVVQPGVPAMLSGTDLAPYLNSNNLDFIGINQSQYEQGKALPEGYYSLCVKAYDYYLANTQVSNEGCAQAWFTLSDPPFLNMPFCNTSVVPQSPQNILFQWTPMNMGSPNSAFSTEYDFELWEIKPDSTANPDQVVLSAPPIYKITTQQTLVNYGIAEPELTLYMKYAWRVRARDLNGYDLFKNKGYSQVCTFNYGNAGKVLDSAYALTLTAQAVTHRMGMCRWNFQKVFSNYLLQVRKQGSSNWFDHPTNLNTQKITNLEPNTAYEARVRGKGSDILTGEWSNTATFTTLKEPVYNCNDPTIPPNLLQASPLPADKAIAGLVIQTGQFEVTATEISSSGGAGWYKGKGYAKILGGFPLAVQWKSIYIDDNNRHQQGVIEAMTKGIDAWMHQWDIQEAEENSIYTNGIIDSIYINGNQVCIIIQGNTTALCYPIPPDANVLVIRDEEGNQYTVTTIPPPPKIEGPTNYLVPSADVLDATDSLKVTFSASTLQKYGFDKKEYTAYGPNYELIKLKNGKNYFVPYKSVGENQTDEVFADVLVKGFDKSLLSFKTKDGTVLTSVTGSNSTQFKVTVPDKAECVYAWYNGKKIGKLNVQSYKPVNKKLVLVPVNASSLPSLPSGGPGWAAANINWTVSTAASFTFNLGTDGLEAPDATLMTKYSSEMRALRDAYRQKDTAYDKNAYYVFVVPGFTDPNYKGYMVRGRAAGFVTANASARDLAHELAHGAFGLEHTFPQIAKGTSNNLLDYSTGTTLTKKQWDMMHTSMPVFNWLDSEEDAAILDEWKLILGILNTIKTSHQKDISVHKNGFTAPHKIVTINNVYLAGVNYQYIKLLVQYQWPWDSIHPQGNIKEVSGIYGGENLDGLDIGGNVWVFVPKNRVANMNIFLTSPADRNLLLFVGGYIPDQEIFTKHPDVVYQSDVWNYWGGIDATFTNQITTYNTIYASGNDDVRTSNHASLINLHVSLASLLTLQRPPPQNKNYDGYQQRWNNGKKAGEDLVKKLHNGTIPCRKTTAGGQGSILDTVDVVAHSMGYAYANGLIQALREDWIHVSRYYILAPENPGTGFLPSGIDEVWQYGSDEEHDPVFTLDGIAPQCKIPGIDQFGNKGGRVFIPVNDQSIKTGPVDSHLAKNYGWILKKNPADKGYVKKRN